MKCQVHDGCTECAKQSTEELGSQNSYLQKKKKQRNPRKTKPKPNQGCGTQELMYSRNNKLA